MGEPKANRSFLQRVVQFVSNPTLDWNDLGSRQDDISSLERSELRAMVERKRRNDFVRKREFDMLRRVRREGLTAEQLAALGPLSRLEDSESRLPVDSRNARTQGVVKAKIDHIEREMVGDGAGRTGRAATSFFEAPTEPGVLARRGPGSMVAALQTVPPLGEPGSDDAGANDKPALDLGKVPLLNDPTSLPPLSLSGTLADSSTPSPQGPLSPLHAPGTMTPEFPRAVADLALPDMEATEIVHDPELDEAVIAFANADFVQCERNLQKMIEPDGPRADQADTWHVVFDLYRATGQQEPFETLAMDFALRFGWSAPQWYSLPQLVAEATAGQEAHSRPAPLGGEFPGVGWVSPAHLDTDAVARLRSHTLQLPLPWVLDWTAMRTLDAEAATQLSTLFRLWAGQNVEMRWVGSTRLLTALSEAAPTGVRDADPAFWLVRLDALRLVNRADQFDETAIDYCVTYEVSPPAWEPARCLVRQSEPGLPTQAPQLSVFSEVSTFFEDSGLVEPNGMVQVAHVDLSGQLVGDLSAMLTRINTKLGSAPVVAVNCTNLIRVDFIAAGDLLNWVLARRAEGRQVQLNETHRLIALFFGAMGINEHARVRVRRA
jgi:hypothetical protein